MTGSATKPPMPAAMPIEAMAERRFSGGASRPMVPTSEVTPVPLTPMPISSAADEEIGDGGRIHEVEPADGGEHANDDDAPGAELVDQRAGERRADAHRELRQRHGQPERLAADVERTA